MSVLSWLFVAVALAAVTAIPILLLRNHKPENPNERPVRAPADVTPPEVVVVRKASATRTAKSHGSHAGNPLGHLLAVMFSAACMIGLVFFIMSELKVGGWVLNCDWTHHCDAPIWPSDSSATAQSSQTASDTASASTDPSAVPDATAAAIAADQTAPTVSMQTKLAPTGTDYTGNPVYSDEVYGHHITHPVGPGQGQYMVECDEGGGQWTMETFDSDENLTNCQGMVGEHYHSVADNPVLVSYSISF